MFKIGMISFAAAAALMMTGCSAEGDKTTTAADDTHVVQPVTMTAKGVLVNSSGEALASQKVVVNGVTVTTGADGSFAAGVTVYPDIEGSVLAGASNNLTISVAEFTASDVNYLGATGSVNVLAQAADGTGGNGTDAVLFQNLAGSTYDFGKIEIPALNQTAALRFEDSATEATLTGTFTLVLVDGNGNGVKNFAGTQDATTGVVTFASLPEGENDYMVMNTSSWYNDGAFGGDGTADNLLPLSEATHAQTIDVPMVANNIDSDGDADAPSFAMYGNQFTTVGGTSTLYGVDGSAAKPLVVYFDETVTVAADAISISWANVDLEAVNTAQDTVNTATAAIQTEIEAVLAAKEGVDNAKKALDTYVGVTDTDATDNNLSTSADATFKTKFNALATALTTLHTELNKIGLNDNAYSYGDAENNTNFVGISVTIQDVNTTAMTNGTANYGSYGTFNFGAANPTNYVALDLVNHSETALFQTLDAANTALTAATTTNSWDEPLTVTVTPTASGDAVSIVTSPALPVQDGSVVVNIQFQRTGVTDTAGNIMDTTNLTAGATGLYPTSTFYIAQ